MDNKSTLFIGFYSSTHVTSKAIRQNIYRRSTVPRIPTAQTESSTESEEEDDRVLDGKVVSPLFIWTAVIAVVQSALFLRAVTVNEICLCQNLKKSQRLRKTTSNADTFMLS